LAHRDWEAVRANAQKAAEASAGATAD